MRTTISILIILLSFPRIFLGQTYKTDFIISTGDSILKSYIGDSLFRYVKYDTDTYYEFKTIFGKTNWETLNKFKNTRGIFINVDMRWFIEIPYPKCPVIDTIRGMTSFVLDSALHPIEKPYLDFIPYFYWSGENCNLITKQEALIIAQGQDLKNGVEPIEGHLEFDLRDNRYIWTISNYLTREKDFKNNICGQVELLVIDAITGEINQHTTTWYGPVY
jgi:hypothetical protein